MARSRVARKGSGIKQAKNNGINFIQTVTMTVSKNEGTRGYRVMDKTGGKLGRRDGSGRANKHYDASLQMETIFYVRKKIALI